MRARKGFVEQLICGLVCSLKRNMKEELVYLGRHEDLRMIGTPFRVYDRGELEDRHGVEWEIRLVLEACGPVWVTNIPREFYDFEDFESGTWDNYDLLLPRYGEVLFGGRREWDYGKMTRKMERDGVNRDHFGVVEAGSGAHAQARGASFLVILRFANCFYFYFCFPEGFTLSTLVACAV